MFTIDEAMVMRGQDWERVDVELIAGLPLKYSMDQYPSLRLHVYNSASRRVVVTLADNPEYIDDTLQNLTLGEWLNTLPEDTARPGTPALGMNQLPALNVVSTENYRYTRYCGNAFLETYGGPWSPNTHPDVCLRPDFATTTRNLPKNLGANALFAIDGMIVPHTATSKGVWLMGQSEFLKHSEEKQISILDFTELGGLTTVDITRDNVTLITPTDVERKNDTYRAVVTVPGGLTGYTPMLVMNGHLHVLDHCYRRIDKDKFVITVNREAEVRRCLRFWRNGLKFMPAANVRNEGYRRDRFNDLDFLVNTHCQFVFIHNDRIKLYKEHIMETDLFTGYVHYRYPKGITYFEDGTMAPRAVVDYNAKQVHFQTIRNYRRHNVHDNLLPTDVKVITRARIPTPRLDMMMLQVLEIYAA